MDARSRCRYVSLASSARAVADCGARQDFAHVGGPGEPVQAGPVLEGRRQFGGRHVHVLFEPQDESGIDRSRSGRHHQAVQRRESHRGVDRPAVADRGQRRARAEVAGDEPQAVGVAPEEFRGAPRDVRVRQPVKSEAPQAPARPPLLGQRERRGGGGDGGVEGGIEARHGGHRGEHCLHGVQGGERLRLVQRRQVGQRLKPLPDLVVHPDRSGVQRAAVHDPVPDGVHRAERLDGGLDLRAVRARRAARADRRWP